MSDEEQEECNCECCQMTRILEHCRDEKGYQEDHAITLMVTAFMRVYGDDSVELMITKGTVH